jgi:hypothetical protein
MGRESTAVITKGIDRNRQISCIHFGVAKSRERIEEWADTCRLGIIITDGLEAWDLTPVEFNRTVGSIEALTTSALEIIHSSEFQKVIDQALKSSDLTNPRNSDF